jgi:hypothetical protein
VFTGPRGLLVKPVHRSTLDAPALSIVFIPTSRGTYVVCSRFVA